MVNVSDLNNQDHFLATLGYQLVKTSLNDKQRFCVNVVEMTE